MLISTLHPLPSVHAAHTRDRAATMAVDAEVIVEAAREGAGAAIAHITPLLADCLKREWRLSHQTLPSTHCDNWGHSYWVDLGHLEVGFASSSERITLQVHRGQPWCS